ncbi:hypothetical protein H634G_03561 [Metarhizium anisopliae BRIP 53293]|uniref:Uncharacterized protein n=1 Tax=Metarhizium anisopliae BRIP 53293 TaxID=1291518 RepID=A0A0D9P4I4_METAN|nr:hypothetical protein H634G_03561 [Metarhizium anisopliae BRIP 53293]
MLYAAQGVERTKLSGVKLPSVVISDLSTACAAITSCCLDTGPVILLLRAFGTQRGGGG